MTLVLALMVIFKILTIKNALVGFGNSGLMTVVSESDGCDRLLAASCCWRRTFDWRPSKPPAQIHCCPSSPLPI